ncbi:MAG TPA: polyprenyl synthetase family protein [Candidatus Hydrogenedentes bacterium]|nr:polyprenyl synthetase family protein [Candidatus Hydrogenedentota bacterium]HOL75529.1 polyprenyl synthetase family protein [Candidatus Hydrogenedentota bacterium]HPO86029.1 polyprenyl synthetase family protein [Candidatus Hydrogenedentota bacterium]
MSEQAVARYTLEQKILIEQALDNVLPKSGEEPQKIHEAMRYAVLSGGKRLRPILTLAVSDFAGQPRERVIHAACSIELIHSASLILDDLPAMDNAVERRGQACTHVKFGEATAILASLALVSLAFDILTQHVNGGTRDVTGAIHELAVAIGTQGTIGGQYFDLTSAMVKNGVEEIEAIHREKSAALFRAAVRIPARILDLPQKEIDALTVFAQHLGLAFQICDDLLDAPKDSFETSQRTHVAHLGLEGARRRADYHVAKAIEALEPFGRRSEILWAFAEYVKTRTH